MEKNGNFSDLKLAAWNLNRTLNMWKYEHVHDFFSMEHPRLHDSQFFTLLLDWAHQPQKRTSEN